MVRYHRKCSKKKYFILLFFIAITMGVGYAYLSSILKIGGTTKVLKPLPPDSFSTDSWDTIVLAVKNGDISKYHVGDSKEITMDEFGTHTVRMANMSTPSECSIEGFSQTACGFVIEFSDIITKHVMNSATEEFPLGFNIGGWPASEMYEYVQNEIYNSLPIRLKKGIINTFTVSGYCKNDSSNFTSNDKLYLLSSMEVWGSNPGGGMTWLLQ